MKLQEDKKTSNPQLIIPKTNDKPNFWLIGFMILSLGGGMSYWYAAQLKTKSIEPESILKHQPTEIMAWGKLESTGKVIQLSVAHAQSNRVNELLVTEGDFVRVDQLIATIQGLEQKQAELIAAKQNLKVLQRQLEKIQTGETKQPEIVAIQSIIEHLQAQLHHESLQQTTEINDAYTIYQNAKTDYDRYENLYREGAISRLQRNEHYEIFQRSQAQLNQAQTRYSKTISTLQKQIEKEHSILNQLREIDLDEIRQAKAKIEAAKAQVQKIESELEDYHVYAPIAGKILKINTFAGERVDDRKGIVELGRTTHMYAIAEVSETDIGQVKMGQTATVTSQNGVFEGQLKGIVAHVGSQIKQPEILESESTNHQDGRVIKVRVRLAPQDSNQVAGLTNSKVEVKIHLPDNLN